MPAALVTTKRKFHKILDSISNASSTSLVTKHDKHNASTTTLPASVDPPTKRLRIERPTSVYVSPKYRISSLSKPKPGSTAAVKPTSSATMNQERKAPNFAPWDRGQFLERLKTFRHVDKWMGKPERINEVQWAKRGWSCTGKEKVGCAGGCRKEVVIKLESSREERPNLEDGSAEEDVDDEDDWREKAQEELIGKYEEMIISAHDGGCLWRRKGCDDTIQRLPLAHQATAIEDLRKRYASLVEMSSELPPNPSMPEDFNIFEFQDQIFPLLQPSKPQNAKKPPTETNPADPLQPAECQIDPPTPPTLNIPALNLALFGWQAEEGHISGLVTCTACFRRLGLWLFKPSSSSSPASPSSMNRLDVVGEHRDYCPWVNALSQNGAASRRSSLDGLAGWQALIRAVRAGVVHRRSENEDIVTTIDANSANDGTNDRGGDDAASEIGSVSTMVTIGADRAERDQRDKERWAKLKRLKQVFQVKRLRGKDVGKTEGTGKELGRNETGTVL